MTMHRTVEVNSNRPCNLTHRLDHAASPPPFHRPSPPFHRGSAAAQELLNLANSTREADYKGAGTNVQYYLRRMAAMEPMLDFELLVGLLQSKAGDKDMHELNPALSAEEVKDVEQMTVATMLASNRISLVNMVLGDVGKLKKSLEKLRKMDASQAAAGTILQVRHCLCRVFSLPSRLKTLPLACVPTAFAAKTLPLPCVFHCLRG